MGDSTPQSLRAAPKLLVSVVLGVLGISLVTTPALAAPTSGNVTFTSSQIGSSGDTPQFTESGNWQMAWTYNCSSFGSNGNFAVTVNQPSTSTTTDAGPNELGPGGSGTDYYTDTGTFTLTVDSECDWSITVSPNTAAPSPVASPTPATYSATTPTRICDTRPGNPSGLSGAQAQCNGKTLGSGSTLAIQVAGLAGVPSDATAVVMNVTATNTTAAGYLTVWSEGEPMPTASDVNWTGAGQSVPNLVTVPLPANGMVELFNSAGSTDVIVDVAGYYAPSSTKGAGLYNPLATPARICDTRPGNPSGLSGSTLSQCEGKAPAPGTSLVVQVAGLAGVPSRGVSAVVLNLTAIQATSGGFLSAYPAGQALPTASNVNYQAGQIVPNRVTVGLGPSGAVEIFSSGGSPNILVDVSGWYTDTSNPTATGYSFTAESTPVRICDTRPGNPSGLSGAQAQCNGKTLFSGSVLAVQVAEVGSVPSDAAAVVANVTATSTTAVSYLSLYPAGLSSPPTVSDLNWGPGVTRANMAVTTLGSSGAMDAYNSSGNVDVIVDVAGWFS